MGEDKMCEKLAIDNRHRNIRHGSDKVHHGL